MIRALARFDWSRVGLLALLAALTVPVAAQAVPPQDGGKYAAGTVIDLPCRPPPAVPPGATEYEGGQTSSSLTQPDGTVIATCARATDAVRVRAVTQSSPIVATLGPGSYFFGMASCNYDGFLDNGVWLDDTFGAGGGQGVDQTRLDCFHDFIQSGGQFEICAGAVDSAGHCTTAPPTKPPFKERMGLSPDMLTALNAYSEVTTDPILIGGWEVVGGFVAVANPVAGGMVMLTGAVVGFSGVIAGKIVKDPPDPQYTTLPNVKAVTMPRVRPGRRLKKVAVRRLTAYATRSSRVAVLMEEVLQGIERYGAASAAGDSDAENLQLSHVRANAGTLAGLLESAATVRKRAARAALGLPAGKRPNRAAWRKMLRRVRRDTLLELTRAGVPGDRAADALTPLLSARIPRGRPTLKQLASSQLARAERDLATQLRQLSMG